MTVTELAKQLGTTADTVRYYTRLKLVKPSKSPNGYKFYAPEQVSRLKFILSARQLGFSVSDIKQILSEASDGKSTCPLVRSLIKQRLAETELQFQAMLRLRQKMNQALQQWESLPDEAPSAHMVCHLIERFELVNEKDDEGGINNGCE
ncbi:MerR family transcriptional regulator [Saccharobesus litoralis]|uniref:MerR family transcriptional regulator n=1 Tax=Saccharobesus litoralis TaxID=2172099 RepID=A0A2S0VUJ3_9ALTE|nr:MerR family transcriptional regulator [Saccharobesus litoralis]AWB67878.1 MerR family transcriptional regulator [Saccharobesus litoralis]